MSTYPKVFVDCNIVYGLKPLPEPEPPVQKRRWTSLAAKPYKYYSDKPIDRLAWTAHLVTSIALQMSLEDDPPHFAQDVTWHNKENKPTQVIDLTAYANYLGFRVAFTAQEWKYVFADAFEDYQDAKASQRAWPGLNWAWEHPPPTECSSWVDEVYPWMDAEEAEVRMPGLKADDPEDGTAGTQNPDGDAKYSGIGDDWWAEEVARCEWVIVCEWWATGKEPPRWNSAIR